MFWNEQPFAYILLFLLITALETVMTDPDHSIAQGPDFIILFQVCSATRVVLLSYHQGRAGWYRIILWTTFCFSTSFSEMVKREESSTASSSLDVSEAEIYVLPNDGLYLCSVPGIGLLLSVLLYSAVVWLLTLCWSYPKAGSGYGFSWSLERLQRQSVRRKSCLGAEGKGSFLSLNFLSCFFFFNISLKNHLLII